MKKILFILAMFFLAWPSYAQIQIQIHDYMTYDWDPYPQLTATDQDTSNNSVIIFNKTFYEYATEGDTRYEFKITHKRMKLITHEGIEDYNKVYIRLGEADKVMAQKARVIRPDGSVSELKKEDFREGHDEETGKKYRYFAFEGIETGCEIEYIYCVKRLPDLDGSIVNLQSEQPVLLFESRYTAPRNLRLTFKSYNGCPEVVFNNKGDYFNKKDDDIYDYLDRNKNIWIIKKENIPPLKNEVSSAPRAEIMKYAMKLDRVAHTSKRNIYSYGPLAEEVYEHVFNKTEAKDAKLLTNLIALIKPDGNSPEARIRQVENYVKSNFIYNSNAGDDKNLMQKIIENKVYNALGSVKLFANFFKKLNIETEIVLTGNRFENKFDTTFECYSFLNDFMLYFPAINKFLDPADNLTRLGFPDYDLINTYGLFIKPGLVDGETKGVGDIKFIEGASYTENLDKLTVKADITPAFSDTKYEIERVLSGYVASGYQPLFGFSKDEKKLKDLSEEIIRYIDKEGRMEDLTFENKGGNFYGQKPLVAKANLITDRFFEKAGNNYLFKAGMLIGPQKGLYEKEERTLPLVFPYNRSYLRSITFNIPEGYKVSNLEKLRSHEAYVRTGSDTTMLFNSDYTLENNIVSITVKEYYKEYSYAVAEFEDYRRIVNTAADFNKVVLVFSKKD